MEEVVEETNGSREDESGGPVWRASSPGGGTGIVEGTWLDHLLRWEGGLLLTLGWYSFTKGYILTLRC